jgi:thioredoxin 1
MEYEFNAINFEEEVVKADVPVLVDMFATWCGPCKMMAPTIEKLAEEYNGKAKIGKVDTDQNPSLAQSYGVQFLPTILIFKNGEVVNKLIGLQDEETLKAELDKVI